MTRAQAATAATVPKICWKTSRRSEEQQARGGTRNSNDGNVLHSYCESERWSMRASACVTFQLEREVYNLLCALDSTYESRQSLSRNPALSLIRAASEPLCTI